MATYTMFSRKYHVKPSVCLSVFCVFSGHEHEKERARVHCSLSITLGYILINTIVKPVYDNGVGRGSINVSYHHPDIF